MPGNIDGFLASTPKGKRKDLPDLHMHCDPPARGGHPPSREVVAAVLRGLFRFEEHLR